MAIQHDVNERRPSKVRRRLAVVLAVAAGATLCATVPPPAENPIARIAHPGTVQITR